LLALDWQYLIKSVFRSLWRHNIIIAKARKSENAKFPRVAKAIRRRLAIPGDFRFRVFAFSLFRVRNDAIDSFFEGFMRDSMACLKFRMEIV
jgi:hypothetical protein